MAEQPQLLKFLLHLYKAPGVSDEEFSKWYREEYIPRAVNILKDYGVEQYKLSLTPSSLRNVFQANMDEQKGKGSGWKMADYDSTAEYLISDPKILEKVWTDPRYEKLEKWAAAWGDTKRGILQVGTEYTFMEGGKPVNTTLKELD